MSEYFQDYKYNLTEITATAVDTTNSDYVWIAFSKNSNGVCLLKKVSAKNLNQVYYTVSVPVNVINSLLVVNGYVYLAVSHPTIFVCAYSVTNPLTNNFQLNKPGGTIESAIQIVYYTPFSILFFLTPGIVSGQVSQLVGLNLSNTFTGAIDLEQSSIFVTNASCVTLDSNNNMWIGTNEVPASLIRVWWLGSSWGIEDTLLNA